MARALTSSTKSSSIYLPFLALFPACFAAGMDPFYLSSAASKVSETFNISTHTVALTFSIFTLCYGIFTPIITTTFPKVSPKNYLLIGLCLTILGNGIITLSNSPTILFLGKAISGVGIGIFITMSYDVAPKLVDKANIGKAIGYVSGALCTGAFLGVPASIFLANHYSWKVAAIVFMVIFSGIGFLCIYFFLPELPTTNQGTLKERLTLLTKAKVVQVVGITFLLAIPVVGAYSFIEGIVNDSDTTVSLTLLSFFWGLGGVIGAYVVGIILDKVKNPRYVILGSMLIFTLALLVLNWFLSLGFIAILPLFVWGAIGWTLIAPQQKTLHGFVSEKRMTGVISLLAALNALGGAAGSALGAVILNKFKVGESTLIYYSLILLVGIIILQSVVISINRNFDNSGEKIKI